MTADIITLTVMGVALLLQVIALIVTAVWIVGKIQTTTQILEASLTHLLESINRLQAWLSEVDTDLNKLGNRVTRHETRLEDCMKTKCHYPPQRNPKHNN